MTYIVKANEIVFCPSLSKAETEIVISSRTKRIFESSDVEIDGELLASIIKAAFVIGNKSLTQGDIELMMPQLREHLQVNNKYSFIGEVSQAIKIGSFGTYTKEGQVLFLSVANIAKWIKIYEHDKQEVLSKQSKYEQKTKLEEEEKKQKSESVKKYWADLPKNIKSCIGLEHHDMAHHYFRNLWKLGLLRLEKEEIEVSKRTSREEVEKELRVQRIPLKTIGEVTLESMAKKRSAEKCFFLWLEENEGQDIIKMVTEAIEIKKRN